MDAPPEYRIVFVTAPSITVARKLVTLALKARAAACANLVNKVESHYWWQGQLESSSEVLIIFKTTADKVGALESAVIKNHPYDTPEFVAVKLDEGTEKYLTWVATSVG